jgi:hypothetical protein
MVQACLTGRQASAWTFISSTSGRLRKLGIRKINFILFASLSYKLKLEMGERRVARSEQPEAGDE